jgi:hypothetical protein
MYFWFAAIAAFAGELLISTSFACEDRDGVIHVLEFRVR